MAVLEMPGVLPVTGSEGTLPLFALVAVAAGLVLLGTGLALILRPRPRSRE